MKKYKTLEEFFGDLDDKKRRQVNAFREIVLQTEPRLTEHLKWNAPSYVLDGEDRITFNLMNKQDLVKVVLHMGARRKEAKGATPVMNDESGLIEWNSDIRGTITFAKDEDVHAKSAVLKKIVKNWLAIS